MRFKPQASGTRSATIGLSGGGATASIPVSGTGITASLGASTSSLTSFNYTEGAGTSTAQSFTITPVNLTPTSGSISLTGLTNYEVSTTSASTGFASTGSISYATASPGASTIWVRLKTGLTNAGSPYNETLALSGGGASANVSLSGTVTAAPTNITLNTTSPATVTSTSAASVGGNTIVLNGNTLTDKGIVYGTSASPVGGVNGTNVSAGNTSSADFSVGLTGLSAGTKYIARAYAYNGSTYSYGSDVTFYTWATAPTAPGSWNLTATPSASGSITLNWSAATFANTGGYVIAYGSTATPVLSASANGNAPAIGLFTNATAVTTAGAGATSAVISSLTPGTTYYFLLVPYNWDGTNSGTYNYGSSSANVSKTAAGTPTVTTTTASVTSATTAGSGGTSVNLASGTLQSAGVVYAKASTSTTPTVGGSYDGYTSDAVVSSAFTSSLGSGSGNATALVPETQYYYAAYVRTDAITGYGSYSSFYTFSAPPTAYAANLRTTSVGATSVALAWDAVTLPSGATAMGYVVLRSAGGSAPTLVGFVNGTAPSASIGSYLGSTSSTTYTDNTVSSSTQYTYVVVPYTWNNVGNSTYNYYTTGTAPSVTTTTSVGTSATDAFRSKTSGAWATAGNWESFTGGSWITASSAPTSSAASISILAGHAMTSTGTVTGKNLSIAATGSMTVTSGTLTLAAGSTLTVTGTLTVGGTLTLTSGSNTVSVAGTMSNSGTVNFNGATATTVSGTMTNTGTINFSGTSTTSISGSWNNGKSNSTANDNGYLAFSSGATVTVSGTFTSYTDNSSVVTMGGVALTSANTPFSFTGSGTYNHAPAVNSTNDVLYASWGTGTTCQIMGPTSATPTTNTLIQNFYHFVWNNNVQTGSMQLSGKLTSIAGDFKVQNTNGAKLSLASNQSPTMTIGGSVTIGGVSGKTALLQGASTSGNVYMTIAGSVNILTGGSFDPSSSGSNTGYTQMNISGDFNLNGGALLAQGTSGTSGTQLDINMSGTGATTQLLTWNGSGNSINSRMVFITIGDGTNSSKVQLQSALNMASSIGDVVVKNKGTLDAQGFVISGSNSTLTFQVLSGATFKTSHDEGLSSSGSTGAVQIAGTRTYNSGGKYTFSGASTGAPTFSTANTVNTLEIAGNVASGFAATQTVTNLVLTSGTFSSASNRTFSIPASGTVTMGGGSVPVASPGITVSFAGAGSFIGNASGTLNNVTINSGAVSLASGTAPTIGGTLLFANASGTMTFGPYYASGSLLQYNTTYTRGSEWNATTTGTAGSITGYPYDVTISSGTFTMLNGASADRTMNNTLTVNSGTTFKNDGRSGSLTLGALNNLGTFTNVGTTGKIIVNGNVSNTGTMTLSTSAGNDMDVYGSWTRVGSATFTDNSRTVSFLGSNAASITAATSAPTFNNLVVNKSGATLTLNNAISTPGNVYLTAGTVGSAANLQLGTSSVITRSGGSLDAAPSFGSTIDVVYTGAVTTGYELPSTNIVRNLTMNTSGTVTLDKAVTVNGTLTLTNGKLDLSSFNLTVPAGNISGGSTTSYVKTSGSGALKVTGVNGTGSFPVGNSTYNPLSIANTDALDWTVNVADAISNVTADYALNVTKAVSRQWNITPSTSPTPSATSVTFNYNGTTDVGASFNNSGNLRAWHYELYNGTMKWMAVSGYLTPATVNGLRQVTVSGLTSFSPYALSNGDAPLPVTFLSFTGKRTNNVNELSWKTASEQNNRGFAVERSGDGVTFTQVGFVATRAQGGTSTSDISYNFTESLNAGTKWYYRLKQVDLDDQYKYSSVVLLKSDKSGVLTVEGIYPNPVKASASVRLQAPASGGQVLLQLTDMQGRTVKVQSVLTEGGSSSTVSLDLSGLAAGSYHLKAISADGTASESVTLIKQ